MLLILFLLQASLAAQDGTEDYLTEESVILITGAAGFLGSELALALYRTYSPKHIICVDRMSENPNSQTDLALFEFQRQRAFNVLQTLGVDGSFYRVDFRPMIPEYFDMGEVPVLDHIFREHPDITHVVHLADAYPHSALQVIPREKDVPKAGMMEALLEQLLKIKREGRRVPHFVYASSFEVYPSSNTSQEKPFTETQTISTPSSLRGASKIIDEMLAKMYNDMHGIYSVGLRFFSIYGPWSAPGSPLFEMAERAVIGDLPLWDSNWEIMNDYVYIDDAVDAMMAAMQFRPLGEKESPLIFNVASGKAHSLKEIAFIMEEYFPRDSKDTIPKGGTAKNSIKTNSLGSTSRAQKLLGYEPQVGLRDGLIKLLAWHYDRAFPYGGGHEKSNKKSRFIASKGIESCLLNDEECLKATPVYPCASECSHEAQCTHSFYDEIIGWTQRLTAKCDAVLYTVDLDHNLNSLPSAHLKLQSGSKSFLKGNCNLAFVSESSKLAKSTNPSLQIGSLFGGGHRKLQRHGEWILVPVKVPSVPRLDDHVLSLLPKLSPGLFFAKPKKAIYIDPNILLDNVFKLIQEASMQPYNEEVEGRTAMLIGKGKAADHYSSEVEDKIFPKPQVMASTETVVQNAAYRMVHIAVSDMLIDNRFMDLLDSRWMVHTLQSDDSRLFRCDVLSEVVQWGVDTDRSALEFVLGLHDMWSRVIAKESDLGDWWIGEGVLTVPEGYVRPSNSNPQRRLQEVAKDNLDDDDNAIVAGGDNDVDKEDSVAEGDKTFNMQAEGIEQEEVRVMKQSSVDQDQDDETEVDEIQKEESETFAERDYSSYDTWMGVLSATSVNYFVRIVSSSEVGVVAMDE